MIVTDTAGEKGVLSGILRYGASAYFDVSTLIKEHTFTEDSNQILYKIISHVFEKDDKAKLDLPTIYSAANELGFDFIYAKGREADYLKALMDYPVELGNVKKFAAKIRKLEIARNFDKRLREARDRLANITGSEKLNEIIAIGEDAIFDFNSSILEKSDEPEMLGDNIDNLLDEIENNPVDQMGISTGWPKFDFAIGGGLRPGTVNIIGARTRYWQDNSYL